MFLLVYKIGNSMKTILIIIGLTWCLIGEAQNNVAKNDSLQLDQISNVLSYNTKNNISYYPSKFQNILNTQAKQLYHAFLSAGIFATSNENVPFWMRSMKSGSIPLDGISVSLIGGAFKEYEHETTQRLMDWGAGIEGRTNAGNKSEFILVEAYAKVRLSIFELKGGRYRQQIGLVDSTLSSGAFALSGNALGIPKVEAGIADYWNVPLTNKVIAIKGNIAHGWMGTQRLNIDGNTIPIPDKSAYLHQLSAYGRIGKPNWKVKLYGGINHFVTWGLENEMYADWDLSKFETFKYVVIGKPHGTNSAPTSKVGNHIGTIDQSLEWDIGNIRYTGYHQFFYDVGALATFANAKDGLWGISLKNLESKSSSFRWNKFLFEFLYSKSQGGEVDSKPRNSGAEDYYNNFEYYNGWSYIGENLGNPMITSKKYLKEEYPVKQFQYFPNNRLIGFHSGAEFEINNWFCKGLLTYSINYGTYRTCPSERFGTTIYYYDPPYFPKVNQLSAYFESHRVLKNSFELGIQLAIDNGELLYNSIGGGIYLTKRW